MKKILFTRTLETRYKEKLQNAGFDVVDYDFLKILPLQTAQTTISTEIPFFKNLVFTSQHAVRIFFETISSQLQLVSSFKLYASSWRYFSTSGETKNALEKYAHSPTLSAHSAKELAQMMLEKVDLSEGVHFICGTKSLPFLPDILSKNGIPLKKLIVYETTLHPLDASSFIPTGRDGISANFNVVVFLSLSAADAFFQKNSISVETPVFTLGKTTADYVHKMTQANRIFAAEKPTIAALIDLIILKCT